MNSNTIHVENGFITGIDGLVRTADGGFGIDPAYAVKPKRPAKSKRAAVYDDDETATPSMVMSDHQGGTSGFSPGGTSESTQQGGIPGSSPGGTNPSFVKSWVKFLVSMDKRTSRRSSLPLPIPSDTLPPSPMPIARSV